MATYDLPAGADGAPSGWTLTPLLNVRGFGAENLQVQRDLGGGSRYILRLDYDVRHGERLRRLHNVFEAAAVPGDDVRVNFAALGNAAPKDVRAVARAKALAGATTVAATVSGGTLPAGALVSVADRIYRIRRAAAAGARTLVLGWPLRADVPDGATIEVAAPTARFVAIGDPPSFPISGRTTAGDLYGVVSVELVEAL